MRRWRAAGASTGGPSRRSSAATDSPRRTRPSCGRPPGATTSRVSRASPPPTARSRGARGRASRSAGHDASPAKRGAQVERLDFAFWLEQSAKVFEARCCITGVDHTRWNSSITDAAIACGLAKLIDTVTSLPWWDTMAFFLPSPFPSILSCKKLTSYF